MKNTGRKPEWLLNLCKGKSPGVILIDGDIDKTPCLDFAYEIGATMMELGVAQRLCVWSMQASLFMGELFLVGDPAVDTHCWTITKEIESIPPSLKPLAGALIEDPANLNVVNPILNPIKRCIHTPADMDAESIGVVGKYIGDITKVKRIGLENLERLNRAVKKTGHTFIVVSELVDSQGMPYESTSYGELALRISIEQGIDLTECAESIISLRVQDIGQWRNYLPGRTLCRPLKIWNGDKCGGEFVIQRDERGRFNFEEKQEP